MSDQCTTGDPVERRTPPASRHQMLEVALVAARAGYHVFPLQVDGKKPIFHAKRTCKRSGPCSGPDGHLGWEQRATTDPDQIRRWWSTKPYNVGIACGPSKLLVIDLDEGHGATAPEEFAGARNGRDVLQMLAHRAGEPMPDQTLTVSTPTGGGHLYFRNDSALRNSSQTGLGWKIDTRGEGGYIVAPGSVRPEGRYQFERPGPPADLPAWIGSLLAPPPEPAITHVPRPRLELTGNRQERYVRRILEGEAQRIEEAQPGGRHHAVLTAALKLGNYVGGNVISAEEASETLRAAVQMHIGVDDFTESEAEQTISDGLAYGAQRPRYVNRDRAGRAAADDQEGDQHTHRTAAAVTRAGRGLAQDLERLRTARTDRLEPGSGHHLDERPRHERHHEQRHGVGR